MEYISGLSYYFGRLFNMKRRRYAILIESAIGKGARPIFDGRCIMVPRYEKGNFIGPTIVCDITSDMECYRERIYGSVLFCMQAESLEDAISIINECRHCNGASIYTTSGVSATKFQTLIEAEQVGINVPVSVPMPFISSGGPEALFARKTGAQFFTKIKTVRQHWNEFHKDDEDCGTMLGFSTQDCGTILGFSNQEDPVS